MACLPWFKIIVASGSALTKAPSLGQSLLMLLDGLQPVGTATLGSGYESFSRLPLGAAAAINPVLTVQVLDSGTFQYLGSVISPVGRFAGGYIGICGSSYNVKVVMTQPWKLNRVRSRYYPFQSGKTATLHLQPLHRYDVGMGGPGARREG